MNDVIFTGTYNYQIDPKGRMRIPADFKSLLGDNLRIGFGSGKFLVIYTEAAVQELAKGQAATDGFVDREKYRQYRNMFYSMKRFECDSQGRYSIPLDMRKGAELDRDVVIAGNNQYVEIWSGELFDRRDEDEILYWFWDKRDREAKAKAAAEADNK